MAYTHSFRASSVASAASGASPTFDSDYAERHTADEVLMRQYYELYPQKQGVIHVNGKRMNYEPRVCRYGITCTKRHDVEHCEQFTHDGPAVLQDCKHGHKCNKTNDEAHMKRFNHPSGKAPHKGSKPCQYDIGCYNAHCTYWHPNGRTIESQKCTHFEDCSYATCLKLHAESRKPAMCKHDIKCTHRDTCPYLHTKPCNNVKFQGDKWCCDNVNCTYSHNIEFCTECVLTDILFRCFLKINTNLPMGVFNTILRSLLMTEPTQAVRDHDRCQLIGDPAAFLSTELTNAFGKVPAAYKNVIAAILDALARKSA